MGLVISGIGIFFLILSVFIIVVVPGRFRLHKAGKTDLTVWTLLPAILICGAIGSFLFRYGHSVTKEDEVRQAYSAEVEARKEAAKARADAAAKSVLEDPSRMKRSQYADVLTSTLWDKGLHVTAINQPDGVLVLSGDMFQTDDGRMGFVANLDKMEPTLCGLGFTSARLKGGAFDIGDTHDLNCR
jgi:hypothetical protein